MVTWLVEEVKWPESLTPAIRESSVHPCPWNACSAHRSHCGNHFQRHSFEKALWCWDHLDGRHYWNQLRIIYTNIRFWWESTSNLCEELKHTFIPYTYICSSLWLRHSIWHLFLCMSAMQTEVQKCPNSVQVKLCFKYIFTSWYCGLAL